MVWKTSPGTFGRIRKFVGITQVASKNVEPEIELLQEDWKDGYTYTVIYLNENWKMLDSLKF